MLRWIAGLAVFVLCGFSIPAAAFELSECSETAIPSRFPAAPPCPANALTTLVSNAAQFDHWQANPTTHLDLKRDVVVAPGTVVATQCDIRVRAGAGLRAEGDLSIAARSLELRGDLDVGEADLVLYATGLLRTARSSQIRSGGIGALAPRMILDGNTRTDDSDACYLGGALRWVRHASNSVEGNLQVQARSIDVAGDFDVDRDARLLGARAIHLRGPSSLDSGQTTFLEAPKLRISGNVSGSDVEIYAEDAFVTQSAVLNAAGNLNFNDIARFEMNGRLDAGGAVQLIGGDLRLRGPSNVKAEDLVFISASGFLDLRGTIEDGDEVEIEASGMETAPKAAIVSNFGVSISVLRHFTHRGRIDRNVEVDIQTDTYRLTGHHVLNGSDCVISGVPAANSQPATGCSEQP